jgi:hypothetical protein
MSLFLRFLFFILVKARLDTGAQADRKIFKNIYSGIVPAILGGVPAAAVFFGTKDLCRSFLRYFYY